MPPSYKQLLALVDQLSQPPASRKRESKRPEALGKPHAEADATPKAGAKRKPSSEGLDDADCAAVAASGSSVDTGAAAPGAKPSGAAKRRAPADAEAAKKSHTDGAEAEEAAATTRKRQAGGGEAEAASVGTDSLSNRSSSQRGEGEAGGEEIAHVASDESGHAEHSRYKCEKTRTGDEEGEREHEERGWEAEGAREKDGTRQKEGARARARERDKEAEREREKEAERFERRQKYESRRVSEEVQVTRPVQELLTLGFLPEEADLSVWEGFGTLTNKKVQIRTSKVKKVIGEYAVGRGLFACQDFMMNEIITVYGGELITKEEAWHRKQKKDLQSHRYLMRISDSDFLVDGWQYASGISETPDSEGVFLPREHGTTQWTQGPGSLANHDAHFANAVLSFVPIANTEALRLLPRVPTLRAHRPIKEGEEILFNYGSSLPFGAGQGREEAPMRTLSVEEESLTLSNRWSDLEWIELGVEAGKLRAVLDDFREKLTLKGQHAEQLEAARRAFNLLFPRQELRAHAPQLSEQARLLQQLCAQADALWKAARSMLSHLKAAKQEGRASPKLKSCSLMYKEAERLRAEMRVRQQQLDEAAAQCQKEAAAAAAAAAAEAAGEGSARRGGAAPAAKPRCAKEGGGKGRAEGGEEAAHATPRPKAARGRKEGEAGGEGGGGAAEPALEAVSDSQKRSLRWLQRTQAWQPEPPPSRGKKGGKAAAGGAGNGAAAAKHAAPPAAAGGEAASASAEGGVKAAEGGVKAAEGEGGEAGVQPAEGQPEAGGGGGYESGWGRAEARSPAAVERGAADELGPMPPHEVWPRPLSPQHTPQPQPQHTPQPQHAPFDEAACRSTAWAHGSAYEEARRAHQAAACGEGFASWDFNAQRAQLVQQLRQMAAGRQQHELQQLQLAHGCGPPWPQQWGGGPPPQGAAAPRHGPRHDGTPWAGGGASHRWGGRHCREREWRWQPEERGACAARHASPQHARDGRPRHPPADLYAAWAAAEEWHAAEGRARRGAELPPPSLSSATPFALHAAPPPCGAAGSRDLEERLSEGGQLSSAETAAPPPCVGGSAAPTATLPTACSPLPSREGGGRAYAAGHGAVQAHLPAERRRSPREERRAPRAADESAPWRSRPRSSSRSPRGRSPHRNNPRPHSPHRRSPHRHNPQNPRPHSPHRHNPRPHNPHRRSPHRHNPRPRSPRPHSPHRHNPRSHSPHSNSPHRHNRPHSPHRHNPRPHSPRRHNPRRRSPRRRSRSPGGLTSTRARRSRSRSRSLSHGRARWQGCATREARGQEGTRASPPAGGLTRGGDKERSREASGEASGSPRRNDVRCASSDRDNGGWEERRTETQSAMAQVLEMARARKGGPTNGGTKDGALENEVTKARGSESRAAKDRRMALELVQEGVMGRECMKEGGSKKRDAKEAVLQSDGAEEWREVDNCSITESTSAEQRSAPFASIALESISTRVSSTLPPEGHGLVAPQTVETSEPAELAITLLATNELALTQQQLLESQASTHAASLKTQSSTSVQLKEHVLRTGQVVSLQARRVITKRRRELIQAKYGSIKLT